MHEPLPIFKNRCPFSYGSQQCVVILIITLFVCFSAIAQKVTFEPVYYNITTEHGLPSMETYSVKQDSKGYIWICTDAGVCRYDGFEFRTFTTKDGLTDNVVFDTYEDHKGRIWFLTYNSMLCYWDGRKISEYQYNYLIKKHLKGGVSDTKRIWIDEENTLFYELFMAGIIKISTDGKLEKLKETTNNVLVWRLEERLVISQWLEKRLADTKPQVKVYYGDSFVPIDVDYDASWHNGVAIENGVPSDSIFFFGNKVFNMNNVDGGSIYQVHGLLEVDINNGIYYFSTLNGVYVGHVRNGQVVIRDCFFKNHIVSSVSFDREGNAWVTTLDHGVYFINDFELLSAGEQQGLSIADPRTIVPWKQDLLVFGLKEVQSLSGRGYFLDLKGRELGSVFTSDGKLYIGAFRDDHLNWDYTGDVCRMFIYRRMIELSDKRLIGITRGRIFEIKEHQTLNWLDQDKLYEINNQTTEEFYSIASDSDDHIYVGSKNIVFELKNGQLYEVVIKKDRSLDISEIVWDANWGLVVGTVNHGVYCYKNGEIRHIGEQEGLLTDRVNTVYVDQNHTLFIGTSAGLYFRFQDGRYGMLGKNQVSNYSDVNAIYSDGSVIYIMAKEGVVILNNVTLERYLSKSGLPMEVTIEKILLEGQEIHSDSNFRLPFETMIFQIDFSVLQFDNWFSKKYQYRIGEESQWVDIESPSISLYRPSGEFDIEIRYMDADFLWSEPVKLCHVKVLLPFWMRWYFWTLIGAGVMLLIFYLYQRRQERVNSRLLQENQMLLLEQQMQHARMNPHFVFNVLNSIHSFVIHEDKDQAELYLMKFSRLMRETLVQSREGSSKIAEECSILIKYLELEQLRSKGRFEFSIQADESVRKCFIPSMLVQPFVENAVLHGLKALESGQLKVTFSQHSEQVVKVCIWDSGQLTEEQFQRMQASGDRNAFGITKLRLEKYNKLLDTKDYGIEVKYGESGTDVCLYIPVLKEDDI